MAAARKLKAEVLADPAALQPPGDLAADPAREAATFAVDDIRGIRWADIGPDPDNARKTFDDEELALLADSIAESGLLQNLVVTAAPDDPHHPYRLVAGERRWRAIKILIDTDRWFAAAPIPCKVIDPKDAEARAVAALLENLVRQDLNPLEEARAFARLRDEFGVGTEEIAGRIHRSRRLVQQRLQLLQLDADDQQRLAEGKINVEQARQIVANKPEPIVLAPEIKLAWLECLHKIAQEPEPTHSWMRRETEIAWLADAETEPFDALLSLGFDYDNGRFFARRMWGTERALRELAPDWETDPGGEIAKARAEAGYSERPVGDYCTWWLNGPFKLSDKGRQILEDAQKRSADLEADQARRLVQSEERQTRMAAARETFAAFLPIASPIVTEVAQIAETIGAPLPWRVSDGEILDANDEDIFGWNRDTALYEQFLVRLVNLAGGFPDAPILAPDADADDDDEAEADTQEEAA